MTTEASAPPAVPKRRGRLLIAGLAVALIVVGGGAWAAWYWLAAPAPPEVDVSGADPDVAEAVEAARAAVRWSPRSAAAWGRLGMVLRAHDFGREANVALAEAERLDSADPRWPYLQGLTLLLGDADAGVEKLRRAVALFKPTDGAPRLRLADALVAQGRPDEAERLYREVLDHDADNPRAQLGLGRLAVLRGDPGESLQYLKAARASPAARKAAGQLLAEVYSQLGAETALAELGDVTSGPDDEPWPDPVVLEVMRLQVGAAAVVGRAQELAAQGDGGAAVELLRRELKRRPESTRLRLALGQTLLNLNDLGGAEQALRAVVAAAPDSVEGWFELGQVQYLRGDRRNAADCFRRTVALKPDYADAHFDLGKCLKDDGDRAGAAEEFRAALRSRPDFAAARKELDDLQK